MNQRIALGTLTLVALTACSPSPSGGDADASSDAGDGDGDTPVIVPPTDPTPPDPPVLTPCPDGWREVADADGGPTECDPWPEGGRADCALDEEHFPGEPGCRLLGTACAAGEWAADLPTDRPVLYVRQGAPAGGSGTQADPFGTIVEALADASPGTVIALGRGTFTEEIALTGAYTLWGACVAETILSSTTPSDTAGVVTVTGAGAVVRNLQITGERTGIWAASPGASVDVNGVLISGARMFGWITERAATGTGHDFAIRGTRARESDSGYGRGLCAREGGRITVDHAIVRGNLEVGVFARDAGTVLEFRDSAVLDTESEAAGHWLGRGLEINSGAQGTLERVVLERNRETGLQAAGTGTLLVATDLVVRDTRTQEDGTLGGGLTVQSGARAEITRALFAGNRDGLFLVSSGTTLVLADAVVRDMLGDVAGLFGRGLEVSPGPTAELARVVVERAREFGVLASGNGTSLRLDDFVVRDTLGRIADGHFGCGLYLQEGAHGEVHRGLFERNRTMGLFAGFGAGTTLTAEDVTVRDTASQESDGLFGRGLGAQGGAQVRLTRAAFEGNRDVSVAVFFVGTTLTGEDVSVRGTLQAGCVATTCADRGAGFGLSVARESAAVLTRFVVADNALAGIQLAENAQLDLHMGQVSGNPIGVSLMVEGYDLGRLQDLVIYLENERNLDSDTLPIPDDALAPDM